jgi:hypothetical protein
MLPAQHDVSTPIATDADPAWSIIASRRDDVGSQSHRVDIANAGHQACSDFGLYAELAPQVPDIPELVRNYLSEIIAESPSEWLKTWRSTLLSQVSHIDAFLTRI